MRRERGDAESFEEKRGNSVVVRSGFIGFLEKKKCVVGEGTMEDMKELFVKALSKVSFYTYNWNFYKLHDIVFINLLFIQKYV